jgi:hypothetical protein
MLSKNRGSNRSAALRDGIVIGTALLVLLAFLSLTGDHAEALGLQLSRLGASNSNITVGLLLLNVALTIYGWRRYRDAARELVERTNAERRAHSLASTDPLTGFLNRRAFVRETNELLARWRAGEPRRYR